VPVFFCHGESINIETEKPFDIKDIKTMLSETKGIKIVDNIFSDDPMKDTLTRRMLQGWTMFLSEESGEIFPYRTA
jgi:aspartate semialdehyde dehydrogenase (EC 1.2.1.11)